MRESGVSAPVEGSADPSVLPRPPRSRTRGSRPAASTRCASSPTRRRGCARWWRARPGSASRSSPPSSTWCGEPLGPRRAVAAARGEHRRRHRHRRPPRQPRPRHAASRTPATGAAPGCMVTASGREEVLLRLMPMFSALRPARPTPSTDDERAVVERYLRGALEAFRRGDRPARLSSGCSAARVATRAAPMMPALLRSVAGTISVSISISGRNLLGLLLTPPPTTISSGEKSLSRVR